MCCIEIIKDNIIAIQSESANNKKFVDKAINDYLDIILSFQRDIRDLNKSISDLHELMLSGFSTFTKEDYSEIELVYKSLIKDLVNLYSAYRKSSFYQGIKTDLKEFRSHIDDLQEMNSDMKTFIVRLPQSQDYKDLVSVINAL